MKLTRDELNLNILIIENETYLAHSIANRLREVGHSCETLMSVEEYTQGIKYDTVLLSSNILTGDMTSIMKKFEDFIVILLVSYISKETVTTPLSLGANDYVIKPFLIDELIKKIDHYKEYEQIKRRTQGYEKYLSHIFINNDNEFNEENLKLPLFISADSQKDLDAFVYNYSIKNNITIDFLSLKNKSHIKKLKNINSKSLIYIIDFNSLKKSEKELFFNQIKNKRVIVSNSMRLDTKEYEAIDLGRRNNIFEESEILTIEEYVKYIIGTYQSKLNDTELSKRLGISRKSIWEKRKKHSIQKVKKSNL